MIIKLLILFLIFTVGLSAQEDSRVNPSVELPDFVITGRDVISVQKVKKKSPDFISTITEKFLKPAFSPEELEMKDLSNPLKKEQSIFDSVAFAVGHLDIGAGLYLLPGANLNYVLPFDGGLLEGTFTGENRRAHVDYSNRYSIGGGANLIYNIANKKEFLGGTRLKANAFLGTSSFNLYGSDNPSQKRILNHGDFGFSFDNLLSSRFNIGFNINDEYTAIPDENFSEHLVKFSGFTKLSFPNFFIGANADYRRQYVTTNLASDKIFDYFFTRPMFGIMVSDIFKAAFGFTYSKSVSKDFFAPYAAAAVKLDKNLTLFGEYAPVGEFFNNGWFMRQNDYFNLDASLNFFTEKNTVINASIKYEFDKYFLIDGGFMIYNADNHPYFTPSTVSGKFNAAATVVDYLRGYLNALFHTGPFGYFYGTAEFIDMKDSSGAHIPYSPKMRSSITYGYPFQSGFTVETKLLFNSESYTDISNTEKIDPYIDLTLKLYYELNQNFTLSLELNNILSRNNYIWYGYKETPFSVTGGFNLRW